MKKKKGDYSSDTAFTLLIKIVIEVLLGVLIVTMRKDGE